MVKPNSLAKTSIFVHLKFTVDKKYTPLPHETTACGRKISSEILENDERFIIRITTKIPFEKDDVDEKTYAKNVFKWTRTVW